MAITREQKETLVAELAEKLRDSKAVVFTDYSGLSVEEIGEVRGKLREQGIEYKVIKNTLFSIAAKEAGLEIDKDLIRNHPIAAAFGAGDETAPARVTYQYSKKNEKLDILGGILEGRQISDIMVKSLAVLPTREELYAKLVGSLASPMSGMVNVLQGNTRGLINVLAAYRDGKS